jgi:hypothetical protein
LNSVASGVYTITGQPVTVAGETYTPVPNEQIEQVLPESLSTAVVAYEKQNIARIEFTSDSSVILNGANKTYQLSARYIDNTGTIVPNAVIQWTSSNATTVSVDATGKVTSLKTLGSADITASYQGVEAVANIIIGQPSSNTKLINSRDVVSVSETQVVLRRTTQTAALQPGQMVVSGNRGGLLARIDGVSLGPAQVTLAVSPVSLADAFDNISVNTAGVGQRMQGAIKDGVISLYDRYTGQLLSNQAINSSSLKCMLNGSVIQVGFTDSNLNFTYDRKLHVVYQVQNNVPTKIETYLAGEISFTGSFGVLDLAAGVNGELDCTLVLAKEELNTNIGLAPITVGIGLTPSVGIKVNLGYNGASLRITGPRIESRIENFRYGFGWSGTQGSYAINEGEPLFNIDPFSISEAPPLKNELTATLTPYFKLLADLNFGIGYGSFDIDFINIDLLSIGLYGQLAIKVPLPLSPTQRTYQGPNWESKAGFTVRLESGIGLGDFESFLKRRFEVDFRLLESDWKLLELEFTDVIWTPPSISLSTSNVNSSVTLSTQIPVASLEPGARAEFWRFKRGQTTGVRIGNRVQLDSYGKASITWTPTSADNGNYDVKAYVFQTPFGGINLPYASSFVELNINASGEPFEIVSVSSPTGPHNTPLPVDIFYSGQPKFPVRAEIVITQCPSGLTCSSGTKTYETEQQPLTFDAKCNLSNSHPTVIVGFDTTLVEANGVRTNTVAATFTCQPGSNSASTSSDAPPSAVFEVTVGP